LRELHVSISPFKTADQGQYTPISHFSVAIDLPAGFVGAQ